MWGFPTGSFNIPGSPFHSSPFGAIPGSPYAAPNVPGAPAPNASPTPGGDSSGGGGTSWWQKILGAAGDFFSFEWNRAKHDAQTIVSAGTNAAGQQAGQIVWSSSPASSMYVTFGLVALVVVLFIVLLVRKS